MRYLKTFNESVNTHEQELQEFCDNNLAYLIDLGFVVRVGSFQSREKSASGIYDEVLEIKIYQRDNEGVYKLYPWNDVNDDLIPFLTILKQKYDIIRVKISYLEKNDRDFYDRFFRTFHINKLLKDKISKEDIIDFIFIHIKKTS